MILAGAIPAPAADARHDRAAERDGPLHRARHGIHRRLGDQAVQRGARRRQRHRRPGRADAVRSPALQDHAAVLRGGRHVPEPRGQSAHRGEPARHHRQGDRGVRRRRHRLGRRCRPLLLPRRHRRVHRRRLHHRAARRVVPDEAPRLDHHLRRPRQLRGQGYRRAVRRQGADEPGRPRLHQAPDARGRRHLRRRGHGALLLPRQLLRRQRLHPGPADPRADVEEGPVAARPAEAAPRALLHLRRDQHQGAEHGRGAEEDRRHWPRPTATVTSTSSTASRWSSTTGTSTCVPRTPSPCSA